METVVSICLAPSLLWTQAMSHFWERGWKMWLGDHEGLKG